ncbi:DNA protecting protein DprA [Salinivibrio sp. ES.052]|nr:DNA protecting protein DprA [Salinivibrio sp. ES.052]
MYDKSLRGWLLLTQVPRLRAQQRRALLAKRPIQTLCEQTHHELAAVGLTAEQCQAIIQPNEAVINCSLEWAEQENCHLIGFDHPAYPALLREIARPPLVLYVQGDPAALAKPQLAMVGSRHATQSGLTTAYQFAKQLAEHGLVITSGLALGIDGRAHKGAMDGYGQTLAVLGSGLDRIYPARHRDLASRIVEQGALVSEFWPDAPPRAEHFPRRNRLISGLSAGVLVVEAAPQSGSLITARYALEQNRGVFAIPGSIDQVQSRGCHQLIKQGATLTDCVDDILNEVDSLVQFAVSQQSELFSDALKLDTDQGLPFPTLLANVGSNATCVDVLAERCNQPVHEIMMQLLDLELQGLVAAVPGGYVRTRRG